ncbi:hypothetical protein [Pedobacter sp. GR22-6]|uniref:hypothetical protein n=1 Tax=Pedobacter sp. GR22-6 TaxID=3127957 RepID=UPI00307D737F
MAQIDQKQLLQQPAQAKLLRSKAASNLENRSQQHRIQLNVLADKPKYIRRSYFIKAAVAIGYTQIHSIS